MLQELALDAVRSVTVDVPGSTREIDIKKYAKVRPPLPQLPASPAADLSTPPTRPAQQQTLYRQRCRACVQLPLVHRDVGCPLQVEKLPGGAIEDCRVLKGVMFQKDVVAPGRMRRKIARPRILLLDCPLEYKKGENQTNVELSKEEDW